MAEEFQLGGAGNWWDAGGTRNNNRSNSMADSVSVSGSHHHHQDSSSSSGVAAGNNLLGHDPSLQIMGLGLSSQPMDWNLFRGEDHNQGNQNFHQQKLFGSEDDLSANDYKNFNRALSLDQQQQQHSTITSQDLNASFHVDSTTTYGNPNVLQGFLLPSGHNQQSIINYSYPSSYVMSNSAAHDHNMMDINNNNNSWSNKFPQFLSTTTTTTTTSQPKPQGQLHFSNNTPFWNASTPSITDSRSTFFPNSLPTHQNPPSSFEDKPKKSTSEVRELAKKTSSEASSNKRPRNETTPTPMPAFKVRKEKMGDRITALQQLVSPFGKTDTASVLSETIEYIKFLHEQVNALSNPYMKSGAHIQHQQNFDNSKDPEGAKQDLRSRGLCLVPVPSTFPVINEPNFDFWNPTFGGTYR